MLKDACQRDRNLQFHISILQHDMYFKRVTCHRYYAQHIQLTVINVFVKYIKTNSISNVHSHYSRVINMFSVKNSGELIFSNDKHPPQKKQRELQIHDE